MFYFLATLLQEKALHGVLFHATLLHYVCYLVACNKIASCFTYLSEYNLIHEPLNKHIVLS